MATSGHNRCRCGSTLKLRLCARRNRFRIADYPRKPLPVACGNGAIDYFLRLGSSLGLT